MTVQSMVTVAVAGGAEITVIVCPLVVSVKLLVGGVTVYPLPLGGVTVTVQAPTGIPVKLADGDMAVMMTVC